MAANAIAVMSYLAADPERQAGSPEIARARGISRALTAKLLTRLAAVELVEGRPGPGGGYRIARPPREIHLVDIVRVFEQSDLPVLCPFGHNWCGVKAPCPLHDRISRLVESNQRFIKETDLSVFQEQSESPSRPAGRAKKPPGEEIEIPRALPGNTLG